MSALLPKSWAAASLLRSADDPDDVLDIGLRIGPKDAGMRTTGVADGQEYRVASERSALGKAASWRVGSRQPPPVYWLRVLERSWQRRMGVLAIQYEHAAR